MLLRIIEQNQWMIFAAAGGLFMALLFVLAYNAMWKSRKTEEEYASVPIRGPWSFFLWFQIAFPWILVITIAGTLILAVVFPIMKAHNPPNW